MPEDHERTTPHSAVKECPYNGCDWTEEYDPESRIDELAAEDAATIHFESHHGGTARVRVVLERDVFAAPGRDLSDIVDRYHDRISDEPPTGFDVAFAYGEFVDEPEDKP